MKRYLKIMCRFIIVQCIAVIMIYCFQIYAKERYENPKLKREDDYVIEWHDKNLEKAIREQTRIETGNIKLSEIVTYINAGAAAVGVGRDFYQGFTAHEITDRTKEILTEVKDFTKWNKK